ncbi:uncharacterized protein N7518_006523 [Penicillium psychrosexuale]|uniref:uncharacterized protein n=1 Tax=Penicillium psychrosexuale TaxID=1002107 RepID=UPI0025459BC3|nr:uncharacterized protein N7518_006523 [Penicillium psychrosexuale]KAJ5789512.1 hypothetical protein N7518_006523 [Penicillium psychrosexuale]
MKPATKLAKENAKRLCYPGFYRGVLYIWKSGTKILKYPIFELNLRLMAGLTTILLSNGFILFIKPQYPRLRRFIEFYNQHFIIPFFFLPHITHFYQPLDSQAFQILKHHFLRDLEKINDQSQVTRRYIRRSIDTNLLLSQEVAILKAELKKAGISRSNAEAKKNGRSILGTRGLVLAPTYANKKMVDRRTADSKKLERFQAKYAKKLEAEQQAQKARDLVEAEHKASMLARNPNHGNWYMDSQGGYL